MQWLYTGNAIWHLAMKTRFWLRTYTSSKNNCSNKIFKNNLQKGRTGHVTRKIRETGSTNQRHESDRLKHARTEVNVTTTDELVGLVNQRGQKLTHRSTRQTSNKMHLTQCNIILRPCSEVSFVYRHACCPLLLVFLTFIFHKVVWQHR